LNLLIKMRNNYLKEKNIVWKERAEREKRDFAKVIAEETCKEFIRKGEEFDFLKLQEEIIERGGILRIYPGYTIKNYMEDYIKAGMLEYDSLREKLIPLVNKESSVNN
jgi:hypothetical protein